jgi:hypothetical protein
MTDTQQRLFSPFDSYRLTATHDPKSILQDNCSAQHFYQQTVQKKRVFDVSMLLRSSFYSLS